MGKKKNAPVIEQSRGFVSRLGELQRKKPHRMQGDAEPPDLDGLSDELEGYEESVGYEKSTEKRSFDAAKASGNPVPQSNFDRSPSRALAWGHPSLRQSSTDFGPVTRTGSGETAFTGQVAFGGLASTDAPPGADHGQPRVRCYDAASEAGRYYNMQSVSHFDDTDHATGSYDSAPIGQSNGSHDYSSQSGAATPARYSMGYDAPGRGMNVNPHGQVSGDVMKASDRLQIMKETMRRV